MFRLVFTTCLALLLFAPAQAMAETSQETAQKLETMFSEMLESYAYKAEKRGFTLLQDGQIMVETAHDKYYAVTLPSLSLKYPKGGTLKIGMVAANVLPTEKADEWKISMAIPTPMIFYNKNNTPEMRLHIGGQNFSGIWNERLGSYSKFDGQYQDIRVENTNVDSEIIIPSVAITADLSESEKNIWSGNARYKATGVKFVSRGTEIAHIGLTDVRVDIFDYAAVKAQDYQEKLQSLNESIEAGDAGRKGSTLHIIGMYNLLTNVIGDIWDGFSIEITIEDVEIQADKAKRREDAPEKIFLEKAGIGFMMKGFNNDSVTLRMHGHHDGLKVVPPSPRYNGMTPDRLNFDISINRLPYRKLVELGQQTLKKTADSASAMSKLAGIQALALAPQILSDAGTNLIVGESIVGNDDYHIKIEGQASTDIKAFLGGTAELRAEIFGIDKILEHLSNNLNNPELTEEEQATIEKNIQSLEMLKRMGLQKQNEQGKFIMSYDLKLTKEGTMLLNGNYIYEDNPVAADTKPQSK